MADSEFGAPRGLRKLVFASDNLPPGLDDESRFRLWRDIYSQYGALDLARLPEKPSMRASNVRRSAAFVSLNSKGR
jgi:hypothetical protein